MTAYARPPQDRAYDEKRSNILEHASHAGPTMEERAAARAEEKEKLEQERDLRRQNHVYSDMFGRPTPAGEARGRNAEGLIPAAQDW